ncbi:glucosaminidase domain and LysM peptidoglycan-binding domain-containing protein [Parapedobacter koreensis]|uniref:Peptidoglycan hydrolase n=1 Tax=Parapedobacter koreensis TaxID=332977 RepID=A0A1H7T897_9SPHI|nr:glucosaminidase domain-containing protein [Parapedobacter koreensis]SEL80918.1 Flagellum-specific peptidoglycan hydrolase FlgJ [Parapedobacter koreensis]
MKGINKTTIALSLAMWLTSTLATRTLAQESPETYIEHYKDAAIQHMEAYGCPASIILAIAMHESAHGTSRVARHLNNHFGIKGPNSSTEIRSAYKGYDSVTDSYQDFIDFLKRRKGTEELFDLYQPHEYQKWVQGIARSGYAHSGSWSSKVLGIIRKYNLHELDKQPEEGMALAAMDEPEETAWYTVKQGDTLYDIARKYGTTVKTIQRNNGLTNSRLHIGQQLLL